MAAQFTRFENSPASRASTRPILRGTMHGAAAALAPFALLTLLLLAGSPRQYVGAAVFGTSLFLLYGSSASYHLVSWSPRQRRVLKRIDHSMIFVLIAGTYTPFCLVVLGNAWGIPMLCVVWVLAAAGVLLKVLRPDAPRWLGVCLYIGLGWVGVIAAAPVVSALPVSAIAMLLLGGMLYSVGAVTYAMRRPDPLPRIFGYHEVFHALVIAGSALHFALIATYVIR